MKRKLVQQGAATMMVSLPASWVKKKGLGKGKEVEVTEKQGSLIISTKQSEFKKKTIRIEKEQDYMNRLLDTPYIQGYDEITVEFKDVNVVKKVLSRAEMLLGFEVVAQTSSSCTIRNVAQGMEEEFDTILRRLFLLVKTEAEDSLKAIEDKNFETLKNIPQLEKLCHKYYLFCYRLLTKYGHKIQEELPALYLTIFSLEAISDQFSYISKYIVKKKKSIDVKAFKDVVKVVKAFEKHFYNPTQQSTFEIREKIKKTLTTLLKTKHDIVDTKLSNIAELYYQLAPFII